MTDRRSATSGRRPWLRWVRRRRVEADPGENWAAEVLGPLRRQTVQPDVARRVMARIATERYERLPIDWSPRANRLAWVSSLSLAAASLVFLSTTILLLVIGGDEGVHEIVGLGLQSWHVLAVFGRLLADLGARVLAWGMPILRAVLALLEVGAPLLRGAGIVAAIGGMLSILFSTYVFASARKTAPKVNFQGGIR